VFLVTAEDMGEGVGQGEAVTISASSSGAEVTVTPDIIAPGEVAEVNVVPEEATAGDILKVIVLGEREEMVVPAYATIQVMEGEDLMAGTASEMRERFIPWLAENHPELGITVETEWEGTVVRPNIMVVMYYLFFSEDWEMGVTWHVTIPPHNWARIYLRDRTGEVYPSYAFEVESWSEPGDPYAIDVPDSVWR